MSFSGLKDVDREILKHVDDDKLLKICTLDRKTWNEVCDDNFLRRRLSKYPGIEKYKKENESWKEFFLQFVYYTSKMKEDHKFEYKSGDFRIQYKLLNKNVGGNRVYRNNWLLNAASEEGELDLVKYAISNGASVTSFNNGALRKAAARGYLDMVKFLVENGANIHLNILPYAAQNGHLEVVKYLVENGVNAKNNLIHAGNLQVGEYLTNHGADIHREKNEALQFAALKGRFDVLKWLIDNGANIHTVQNYPLRWEAHEGHFEIVKYLIEHGADIHAEGDDALSSASENGHLELVKYLVEQGANINAERDYALQIASENGHLEVVKYLIEHGATRINQSLRKAEENRRLEVANYLKRLV